MAKPYSQDLRDRLVLAVLSGQSRRNVARSFDVSPSCVIKLMQQWETTGDCLPRNFGGHKRHALAEHEDQVRALVAAQPDLTITALWKGVQRAKSKGKYRGRSPTALGKTDHCVDSNWQDLVAVFFAAGCFWASAKSLSRAKRRFELT